MHRLKILKILFLHSNILEHFTEKQNTPAAEQNAAAQECSQTDVLLTDFFNM